MNPKYYCPHCQTSLNSHTPFCGHCGGKLPAELALIEYLCHGCGHDLQDTGRLGLTNYCEQCGMPVSGQRG